MGLVNSPPLLCNPTSYCNSSSHCFRNFRAREIGIHLGRNITVRTRILLLVVRTRLKSAITLRSGKSEHSRREKLFHSNLSVKHHSTTSSKYQDRHQDIIGFSKVSQQIRVSLSFIVR